MEDRRKHRRILIHHKLKLQFPEDSPLVEAEATNLGFGGIGIYSSKRIPVGGEVLIRIGFIDIDQVIHFEKMTGTVKWCRTKGFGFAAGIQFKGLNPDEHPRVYALLMDDFPLTEAIYHPDTCDKSEE